MTVTATTGTLPGGLSSGSIYIANRVDDNRISFTTVGGTSISFTTYGSTDLVYRIQGKLSLSTGNTIEIPGNTLLEGASIEYDTDGGTAIGGLVNGTSYFTAFKNGDRFKVSTTANPYGVSEQIPRQDSASFVSLAANYVRLNSTMPFVDGDAVEYTALGPIVGLNNGEIYWVETYFSTYMYLHRSKADAIAGSSSTRVDLVSYGTGSGTFTKVNIVDLTSIPSPSETQVLSADYVGAADGNYVVASTASDNLSFTFDAGNKIEARNHSCYCAKCFCCRIECFLHCRPRVYFWR